jgi:capsular polysaccharide export protein
MPHSIAFLREYRASKDAAMQAVADSTGWTAHALRMAPLSWRDWPETPARVAEAMATAKKQPRGGFGRWAKALLLRLQYNGSRRYFLRHPGRMAVAWNGMTGTRRAFLAGARDAGAVKLHVELAPLPGRITLDPAGVNFDNSVPRSPAFFRDWLAAHPALDRAAWRELGARMTARPSRRADVGQGAGALPDSPFLLCPLQVPDDSQVLLYSGWCGGLDGFLAALAQGAAALPEGWHIRLKEHPSAKVSLKERLAPLLAGGRLVLDNDTDSFAQVAASRGVITLNSSMGLQAFFFDKPVVTLGQAFFSIPGLVNHAPDQAGFDALMARAGDLGFDADLRDAFMTWLVEDYYPVFRHGEAGAEYDRAAFGAHVARVAHAVGRPVPGAPMRKGV